MDNAKKELARKQVAYAIRAGAMTRPGTCESCGSLCVPEAHHEDYDKPLDVVWLCTECHGLTRRGIDYKPSNPVSRAIASCMKSGDAEMVALAECRVMRVIYALGGNAMRIAEALDITHRTFMRWAEYHPAIRSAIDNARFQRRSAQLCLLPQT